MAEKKFPFYCEWCGKIKEATIHEPDHVPDEDLSELSLEEIAEKVCQLGSNPHYICAECLRKILNRDKEVVDQVG